MGWEGDTKVLPNPCAPSAEPMEPEEEEKVWMVYTGAQMSRFHLGV